MGYRYKHDEETSNEYNTLENIYLENQEGDGKKTFSYM
jgi:hypothetical protein